MDRMIDAGLTELNHNLETGRSYFSKIVSSHTYDDRIETIRKAKSKGLRTCVGGIFGMGEKASDRVELAESLRELDVDEVPLNFLVNIEGTKLPLQDDLDMLAELGLQPHVCGDTRPELTRSTKPTHDPQPARTRLPVVG
jgi:biotin synthase